jgi:hypothetical protein
MSLRSSRQGWLSEAYVAVGTRYDETSSRTPSGTRIVESLGTDEVHANRTTAHDSALIHRKTAVTKESWQAPLTMKFRELRW